VTAGASVTMQLVFCFYRAFCVPAP